MQDPVDERSEDVYDELGAVLADGTTLVRAVGSGRRRGTEPPPYRRVELRYVDLKTGRHLQITEYDERQAHIRNTPAGAGAGDAVMELLGASYGSWHVETTSETLRLRYTKKGRALLHRTAEEREQRTGHDRVKERLLDPAAPFLRALGISDRHGTVKPSRQSKYKQVEEFCKILAPSVDDAIAGAEPEAAPDVVLALHACDTATDDALARAVEWQAPLVLAAPCCHHDLQRQLKAADPPSPYAVITRYGIVLERFADVLTDALRASVLRQVGYRVEVMQFVDSEHTPRNLLLRAARTGAPADETTREEYEPLTTAWHVTPRLATLVLP